MTIRICKQKCKKRIEEKLFVYTFVRVYCRKFSFELAKIINVPLMMIRDWSESSSFCSAVYFPTADLLKIDK